MAAFLCAISAGVAKRDAIERSAVAVVRSTAMSWFSLPPALVSLFLFLLSVGGPFPLRSVGRSIDVRPKATHVTPKEGRKGQV